MDYSAATNVSAAAITAQDIELMAVRDKLMGLDPEGRRFGRVLRDSIDQLLNGEATGRYDWQSLLKTEKTHAGTIVEINLQRDFQFEDGTEMDYKIAGSDVDCKYSQDFGKWMIPPEATGHLCLLVWADDYTSRWSAGLLRIQRQLLNGGENRDLKTTIKAEHRNKIYWLWRDAQLPENVLLHLNASMRNDILSKASGQGRVNELFRRVQMRLIGRGVVRTVAQQSDYMARIREAKGRARTVLRGEGILIAGHYGSHQAVVRTLGGPVPQAGELVSFRVAEAMPLHAGRPKVLLDGTFWVLADDNDPECVAPHLPKHTEKTND
ncbi:NaeI family type II restriction endonuclease [Streptomyces sp. RKAG337]|uniref:NaeI family type II restriction endonuclease n=1 Tax=Streptomyces sp. RKAG337 TaxID=2893404 RepID=UPI0027E40934|nr:NaeI family type II restriction endonuclease [Streptomyces sp. RKAG337]